jgi:fumarate hydratase class II
LKHRRPAGIKNVKDRDMPKTTARRDNGFRLEEDSLGEVRVPSTALYGAQTQRAIDNFPISGLRLPPVFIHSLGELKAVCAEVNRDAGRLNPELAEAIAEAAREVENGRHDDQFPLDVFQTGSATSTNMNANEVIATLASRRLGRPVNPNDHVNCSQSSNDVIPTVIHVSAWRLATQSLLPALEHLRETIDRKAEEVSGIVKTGRTHLMDAVPIRLDQELGAWSYQVESARTGVRNGLTWLAELAIGGTAVGSGLNAPPGFGAEVSVRLAAKAGFPFVASPNPFAAISGQQNAAEFSGALKAAAVVLFKIANDLRWMNSGPEAGLGEITLPALQPGSSIMPGKVNPVIPEAVAMACLQVQGNDCVITQAAQAGSFQLNTMLPLIAYNLLQSIQLLGSSAALLADRAIKGFTMDKERLRRRLERNPILATALAPRIGYKAAAEIVQRAIAEGRSIREVAASAAELAGDELDRLLDPEAMTRGGVPGA